MLELRTLKASVIGILVILKFELRHCLNPMLHIYAVGRLVAFAALAILLSARTTLGHDRLVSR